MCVCVCVCVFRFDLEQNQAQAEVQRERSQREKLAREKDLMTGEMFNLRQQLQVSPFTLQMHSDVLSQGLHVCSLFDVTGLVQVCLLMYLVRL